MAQGFRHEALLYADGDEYLAGTIPFIREGLEAGEPVLIAVPGERAALLKAELGAEAEWAAFIAMEEVGRNPSRIISAWHEFIGAHASDGSRLRGIGEPIWAGRSADEIAECQRHESLLNLAFNGGDPLDLLCPYDSSALDASVLDEARRSHPTVAEDGSEAESHDYLAPDLATGPFEGALPSPPEAAVETSFVLADLRGVRKLVAEHAAVAGLEAKRTGDLALAVTELAVNSVRHGGGGGVLAIWPEAGAVVCEVRDSGYIDQPLAGRRRPRNLDDGGRGLWLVHQLCDFVQVRSRPGETAVRVHMHTG
jgi:anti-sigma regulatory factor (Ser/Thr protein kinase)